MNKVRSFQCYRCLSPLADINQNDTRFIERKKQYHEWVKDRKNNTVPGTRPLENLWDIDPDAGVPSVSPDSNGPSASNAHGSSLPSPNMPYHQSQPIGSGPAPYVTEQAFNSYQPAPDTSPNAPHGQRIPISPPRVRPSHPPPPSLDIPSWTASLPGDIRLTFAYSLTTQDPSSSWSTQVSRTLPSSLSFTRVDVYAS